ncbi:MAG TPA: pantoate--beta-alanine ligase [Thiotrichaceae bacterium]|jgi:pantoate--beta-alanine ligase|nr:pantoate--beta-alanine ligase [Thiotrichaceae bacterium]HIM07034.1 pantoate--beta-alanine ligase [Gammaproteobacteria bacterium]
MEQIRSIRSLREQLVSVRRSGKKIALVPTMGNLHEGHLSLVKQVQKCADYVVVSIFVNPTQFVEGEDFGNYPRTLESDLIKLENLNVDLVFMPDGNEIYPEGNNVIAEVTVSELESIYCGEFRPGHFKGVATVVTKLFNIVQPDLAIFGKKDYQQLLVIRSLVENLNLPIEIMGSATMREEDGLAMSSRNQYLTESERQQAPILYKCISEMASAIKNGESDYEKLEKAAVSSLKKAGFKPEYLSICDSETLKVAKNQKIVIIAAAWLGKARLIDNIVV